MIQWLRSLIFIGQMYLAMPVLAVVYLPWALFSPAGAHAACHAYCRWVFWTLGWMVGLKVEVRGEIPTDEVMIAAKHQSFLDIMMIYNAVPRGKFIMKRILMFAPILGQYALRIGCVPVNRGKRGAAIKKMLEDVRSGQQEGGQLIIYPQGTRVAPGDYRPYKIGTGALYEQMEQPCVPVAANVGAFWPKHGITRKPGVAVVEFLPRIEPGLSKDAFMARLETEVETASNALLDEVGFRRD
ncbi:1-acyl-sn-glycerol-3-phosphate acyltransferase [Roseobacter sp. HKCCD9010]|uniref:lysophospholipid acyltransferase family protein n=1 Tax=unclassified Roseobacter TaxID=196798 RepID=UPI0014910B37|nr:MULTISPECIES: lysophospholipid acyltransferase family protein [unclassified Roseobacter]MBF9050883.1 1-acyl-sn-glycerol-3-phosphate acyltransferase [Rhodobacterales bacterium HKCCD4356]NNV12652.1 1-acyl-sn-glycerol-3-phosphate acyltransferase [Roseobacter sp. HKCCD7357]NNV16596.1 1-acyl-sn-glycerol-3-phosphate acyltransferase [Roseobacter sp. HKCCD8768]NNV26772.1 1-acyl-sn-glycerol-3-phosphate acyltransferase [Roseobacter sp. HKCCD8192]NNV30315.1 1-acyl-sn-glycerol-3-phosphate acyltransfera